MSGDHYTTLGVSPTASHSEIRAAYLRVMRATHPDHAHNDPIAADRARRANAAYEVLGDAATRAAYDRLNHRRRWDRHDPATPSAGRAAGRAAYSPSRVDYALAFRRASLRGAVTVLGLGMVLLALAGA
jgi:DnaJ-class molecular chaperone